MKRLRRLRSILLGILMGIVAYGLITSPTNPVIVASATIIGLIAAYPAINEWLDRFGGQPKRAPRQSFPTEQNYLEGRLRYFAREREFFVALAGNTQIKTQLNAFEKGFEPRESKVPTKEYDNIAQAAVDYPRFVIVGDPGAGKSTSLKNLAESAIRARLKPDLPSDGARVALPLWIDLGHSNNPPDAEDLLEFWWAEYGLPGNAHSALKTLDIWLFLDGLNEMPEKDGSRADRAKSIRALLGAHPEMRAIATCRIRDYEEALDLNLPVVRVRPLDAMHIEEFARLRLKEKADGLMEVIAASRALEANASNPYTLAMLIKVFESGRLRELLKDPSLHTLYGQYVQVRYDDYQVRQYSDDKDERRRIDKARLLKLSIDQLEAKLQHLAFRMIADRKGTVADARWAQRRIGLRVLRDGINLGVLVQENDSVRFFHQSLHGYFALPGLTHALKRRWYDRFYTERRKQFITRVADLGETAAPAIPALIAILANADVNMQREAIVALSTIGRPAVPPLIDRLQSGNVEVRRLAAWGLGNMGAAAVDAVSVLVVALNDSDIRHQAGNALGGIGASAVQAVPALASALQDSDLSMRSIAVKALRNIGAPAVQAVPALTVSLRDTDPVIRRTAAEALRNIGTPAVQAVPALIGSLHDADDSVRFMAAWALGEIGESAAEAVPSLIKLLEDERKSVDSAWRVLDAAVDALHRIGTPEARKAIVVWRMALNMKNDN